LAFALGFNLSISRLGSVINGDIVPVVYNAGEGRHLGLALFVGFAICILSLITAILLGIIILL
jgi:hypothetical protein